MVKDKDGQEREAGVEFKPQGNDGTGNVEERDDWHTPHWLFDMINKQYDFTFDCCASKENSKCKNYSSKFESEELYPIDGRVLNSVAWMNPPFSKAEKMFKVFFGLIGNGVCIYRCDNMETKIWQDVILKNATWIFIPRGRISYEGKAGKGSRFPSALIGFNVPVPNGLDGATLNLNNTTKGGRE